MKTYKKLLGSFLLLLILLSFFPISFHSEQKTASAASFPYASWYDAVKCKDPSDGKGEGACSMEEMVPDMSSPYLLYTNSYKFEPGYFVFNTNWTIYTENNYGSRKQVGSGPLLRPAYGNQSNLGRIFFKRPDYSYWGSTFNGNPDFVSNVETYTIYGTRNHQRIYIRDVADYSGATLDLESTAKEDQDGLGKSDVIIYTTPYPEGEISGPSDVKAGESNTFTMDGQSFVEMGNKFYNNDLEYELLNVTDGVTLEKGTTRPSFIRENVGLTFNSSGLKELKLKVTDQVERSSSSTFYVYVKSDEGDPDPEPEPDPDPDPLPGGECEDPGMIGGKLRYDYELDFYVERIEAETVDSNQTTETIVKVRRKDYSSNRKQVENEINNDIEQAQNEKRILETELSGLETELVHLETELKAIEDDISEAENNLKTAKSNLSSAQSRLASAKTSLSNCENAVPDEDGNTPNCNSERRAVNTAESDVSRYQNEISSLKFDIAYYEDLKILKEEEIFDKKQEINNKKCEVAYKEAEIRGFEEELNLLNDLERQYENVSTNAVISYKGGNKGSKTISLREGRSRTTTYNWRLPSDGQVKAEINPYRNIGIEESTYSNNSLSTPIYVSTHETAVCAAPGKDVTLSGVVRTITDRYGTDRIYERVTASINNLSKSELRAGYGFSYDINTTYRNDDPKSNAYGTKAVSAFYPSISNYLPYPLRSDGYMSSLDNIYKNSSSPPRNQDQEWSLPVVYVEEFSGNVFTSNYNAHSKRDMNDKIINGGRKHYIPFDEKDGTYSFKVRGYDAGVNQMNICLTGEVEVDGTFAGDPDGDDDFIQRPVNPNNPFNGGVGWNWKGDTSTITSLNDWYYEWKPSIHEHLYQSVYNLDGEDIEIIKEYNQSKNHVFDLSDDFKGLLPQ